MMSGRMTAAAGDDFPFAPMHQPGPYVGSFEQGGAAAQRAGMQQHHHHHIYDNFDFAAAAAAAAAMQFQEAPQLLALPPNLPMAPTPKQMPMPMPMQMPIPMPAGDVYPPLDIVKREGGATGGQGSGAAGRIGLNLGRRTYFSPGDMLAVDRLLMRSRLSGVFGLGFGGAHHQPPRCQAEGCKADLSGAKHYHRRHKVCEYHAKASVVAGGGKQQRFCQQCSRFHMLTEFDEAKRSCRKRLAEHNRRRRKLSSTAAKDVAPSVAPGKKPNTTSYNSDSKNMMMSAAKSPISSNTSVISCLAEQGKQAAARPTTRTLGAPPPESSAQLGSPTLHVQPGSHHQHQQEHLQLSSLVQIGGRGSSNNILSFSSVCSSTLLLTATNGDVSDQNNDNSHNNGGNNMHLFEVDFM
ncbi:hypothetical protein GUJ93_ZPchr0012g20741 [Zizania palustris]|uniref:SBP-type domain-containing protein n=1 Tax=Zizania palustris TaxID=103762 RepID=A0A8J6BWR0_ZIZPA|nr:hypothetical protein GUJ93_ZPchr0012g20741 [Zizania palustris]